MLKKLIQKFSSYDVIVIGGGHAGCEAAFASSRLGAKTLLLTQLSSTIGELSCNVLNCQTQPSMGSSGKSQIINEVDAMGGLIARVSDESAINFQTLFTSKGLSARVVREQVDRDSYKANMQVKLKSQANLEIIQDSVNDFQIQGNSIKNVFAASGKTFTAKKFVLTTGTFLRGMIHIGKSCQPAGRYIKNTLQIQAPSIGLARTLQKLNFPIGRCTTGTPPRILNSTINYAGLQQKKSEDGSNTFSFMHEFEFKPQDKLISNFITFTSDQTFNLVSNNSHELPIFEGNAGKGQGPRYCPSLQSKFARFGNRRHVIYIEREGLKSNVVYPTGMSMAFPADLQLKILRSVQGFEQVEMIRPGYSIEYDFIDPKHLDRSLKSSILANLYLAGQINGTTGYQEAAGQGIIAGLNAGLSALHKQQFNLSRRQAYIGVMIDDLITVGVKQPYRMLSARVENRFAIRSDNSDSRLTPLAIELGIISQKQEKIFKEKQAAIQNGINMLRNYQLNGHEWSSKISSRTVSSKHRLLTACDLIANYDTLKISEIKQFRTLMHPKIQEKIQISLKLERQVRFFEKKLKRVNEINEFIDISKINWESKHLKAQIAIEDYELLSRSKPRTLHAASRIPGIRPTSIILLKQLIRKEEEKKLSQLSQ